MTQNTRFGGINGCLCVKTENTRFGGISGCLYVMTHRTHSSVRYVPMTHTPHSSVRYVPTAVCLCRILSRVWRRNRKGTKLTRTVLLFILRPNASFAVPPSYTLVCALVTVSVCPPLDVCSAFIHSRLCLGNGFCMPSVGCLLRACIPPGAGLCTPYCGFLLLYTPYCGFLYPLLRVSIPPIVGFYTLYCGFLYALLWVSVPPSVGFCTLYCGFLYALLWVSIPPSVGFYTLYCGFLYALLWVSMPPSVGFYTLYCGFLYP